MNPYHQPLTFVGPFRKRPRRSIREALHYTIVGLLVLFVITFFTALFSF